jgi:quercetin dioxygenase-like cupin family protein
VQFVYVLKGWVEFEYEGVGKVMMRAGSCFYQPSRIRHREIRHSQDIEMLEIVSPAVFETRDAKPPASRKRRMRH